MRQKKHMLLKVDVDMLKNKQEKSKEKTAKINKKTWK